MTHQYTITGMTCNGCVGKAKSALLGLGDVTSAEVQLAAPQATIQMQKHVPLAVLQQALSRAGNYTISEESHTMQSVGEENNASWFSTYKPVLLIGAYITGVSLLLQFINPSFDLSQWMRHFMAGFFLVFSFFKMLDINAFAESYASYDIIAKRAIFWGYLYPFIELGLGIAYLLDLSPMALNSITLLVMGISIIGVLQSVLNKRKIQCACLGAVFNLPMSSITIIEDALMILMSAGMIISML